MPNLRGAVLLPLVSGLTMLGGLAMIQTAGDSSAIGFAAGMMIGQGMMMFAGLRFAKSFGPYSARSSELTETLKALTQTVQFVNDMSGTLHKNMAAMLNEVHDGRTHASSRDKVA